MEAASAWDRLESGWQVAFDQAWLSFQRGSFPVGAALIGPEGSLLAAGRNRIFDDSGQGPVGSLLAHAEVDVLSRLSPEKRHDGVTLFTTLEPCLYCVGAVVLSRVGAVRFAGADGYGGATHLPFELNAQTARYELAIHGPLVDPFGRLGSAISLVYLLTSGRWTRVVEHARQTTPKLLDLAEKLGRLEAFTDPGSHELESVLTQAWPVLLAET